MTRISMEWHVASNVMREIEKEFYIYIEFVMRGNTIANAIGDVMTGNVHLFEYFT